MTIKFLITPILYLIILASVGCNQSVQYREPATQFTGVVKSADGKPIQDVTLHFLPQFPGSIQTTVKINANGKFEADLLPGKYVIMFEPNKGKQSAFNLIPAKYHVASKENEIDVIAGNEIQILISK